MKIISGAVLVLAMIDTTMARPSLIEELSRKCTAEEKSLFKENNGTPSCRKLVEAIKEDKLQRSDINKVDTYKWNSGRGTYCYYNSSGDIMSCP
jgi:flagellar biosynthesis protein FlhB